MKRIILHLSVLLKIRNSHPVTIGKHFLLRFVYTCILFCLLSENLFPQTTYRTSKEVGISVVSFTGICNNNYISLSWRTVSETNNHPFNIERSINAIDWQVLDTISGNGISGSSNDYSYIDKQPSDELSYYRLKQSDSKGDFKYFDVIAVEPCKDEIIESLTLYPNPSKGKFDVLLSEYDTRNSSIEIFNQSGVMIYSSENIQSTVDLSGYLQGVYFIHLNSGTKRTAKKFLLQN